MSKNWVSTLRLPKSKFPPRPQTRLRDQYIQRCADDLYKWQVANRPADSPFVLHDGPPYANGSLHAGHALNKILKDIILRVQIQQGKRVSYVPGWDCHGLPIESKALGASGSTDMTPLQIRKAASTLASVTVLEQMKTFRSFAVMGDWDNRWTTMDKEYEIRQLQLFQRLVEKGLIYRRYKPVYWSPSSGTALAEAELEYNHKHISKAAYVRFPVAGNHDRLTSAIVGFQGLVYLLVWTTTPWTLPANQAIAVHDELTYLIVQHGDDVVVVSQTGLDAMAQQGLLDADKVVGSCLGRELQGLNYINKLRGKSAELQPIIHAPFVVQDSGTGLVHCAPGHGFDDYLVCREHGIPVLAPVDGNGQFTDEAFPDDPRKLLGRAVLEDGSDAVLHLLGQDVMHVHKYKHPYPYDWRTKQPIIMRATAQWFADVDSIKDSTIKALENVRFIPKSGKSRLESFVKGRSEWCISRQRAWGVPIPALYHKTSGNAVMTKESIQHIISVIRDRGIDAWWSDDAHDPAWVPASLRGKDQYARGIDTMDVWFDSGSSWAQMAEQQADIYLEGSDQHRGWFQSSLLTRVAALSGEQRQGTTSTMALSPFKTLITHGFTLDGKGKKMSKSLGNTISAEQVMDGSLSAPLSPLKKQEKKKKKANEASEKALVQTTPAGPAQDALGPDALRLWAASGDYTQDIVLGEPVLQAIYHNLLKYRNMVKMLTGSLYESSRTAPVTALDQIGLVQLLDVMDRVRRHYDNFEFYKAVSALNNWLTNDLSAFYLEALKDRLYCADGGGVLEPITIGFLRMLAPITPLLVEEASNYLPTWLKDDPAFVSPLRQLYLAPLMDPGRLPYDESEIREAIPVLKAAHDAIKMTCAAARKQKMMGSSLQCSVMLHIPDAKSLAGLKKFEDELATMFVVSSVCWGTEFPQDAPPDWAMSASFDISGIECSLWVMAPQQHKCPRCWRYVAEKEDELCTRCDGVVLRHTRAQQVV